MDLMNKKLY